jgi:hypothetical protein
MTIDRETHSANDVETTLSGRELSWILRLLEDARSFQQVESELQRRDELSIELRVAKAIPSDVGHGRVRLPLDNSLGLKPGDIVSVEGSTGPLASRGSTAAIVWRARPEDKDLAVARMDGIIRRNAQLSLGGKVRIRKLEPEPCSELVLCPELGDGNFDDLANRASKIRMGKGIEGFARRGLNKRPVKSGDVVYIPGLTLFAEALPFRVKETNPRGFVTVSPETIIKILHPETGKHESQDHELGEACRTCCCREECRLSGTDADREILIRLLSGMSFSQRQLMLVIAGMISKPECSDSNTKDRKMH